MQFCGSQYLSRCGQGDPGSQGKERHFGKILWIPDRHQRRGHCSQRVELEDKFENMGAQMVKEVASKTSDTAGDGTTTATVLAQALYREGSKVVAAGCPTPWMLKRGMDLAVEEVSKELKKLSKPTKDQKEISQVGRSLPTMMKPSGTSLPRP